MEIVVLVIAIVVGIDAIVRHDKRPKPLPRGDEATISTQKIIVDLSNRL